jgi:Na+/H+ antiporter NhaC
MALHVFNDSVLSLVPAVLAISLSMLTHRVLFSLAVAIIAGALLLNDFQMLPTLSYIGTNALHLVWENGWNMWNISLIVFLLGLGVLTAFITRMGGTKAFGAWALNHIHTQRGARLFAVSLGMLIFIDDYFSSLAVGQVARPVTDQHKIARAKLAYLIDSTSAPVCVLSPLSSWGAYIMGILTLIMTTHHIENYSALAIFFELIPFNFYPFVALLLVVLIAYTGWGIGPMKNHLMKAKLGKLFSEGKGAIPGEITKIVVDPNGRVRDLLVPIITLILFAIAFIIAFGVYGIHLSGQSFSVLRVLEYTDVGTALLIAAAVALISCIWLSAAHHFRAKDYGSVVVSGLRSMMPAIYILLFAWMIIDVIGEMGTGEYLAHFINQNLPIAFLPVLLFLISGVMAFATGTSWGTFGIMLPIAANIAMAVEPAFLMPMMGAVLSGALFGDHASPISDTTILSATGAGCHLMDHVITQMPYAVLSALLVAVGFLVFGFTQVYAWSLIAMGVGFVVMMVGIRAVSTKS